MARGILDFLVKGVGSDMGTNFKALFAASLLHAQQGGTVNPEDKVHKFSPYAVRNNPSRGRTCMITTERKYGCFSAGSIWALTRIG